jgi:RimJ/RimL family protein N-acetyltransferase
MTLLEEIPGESFREGSIPVLETRRLVLRAPRLEDAKAVAALANDRRIAENTARIPHPYKMSDAEAFIGGANKAGGEVMFLITANDGKGKATIMGAAGIMLLDRDSPELGYWLGVPYWGNGFATEALHAVVDYAFGDLDHAALYAGARVTNPASRRWKSAAFSGPASGSIASPRSALRRRSTGSGSSAVSGRRSRAGAKEMLRRRPERLLHGPSTTAGAIERPCSRMKM